MSPVCPRCGGELKEVVIFAWKHVYADMEENCGRPSLTPDYIRERLGGKDASPVPAGAKVTGEPAPVPANPAQERVGTSAGTPPILRREYFSCPRCGNKKEWLVRDRHPWPGAVCRDCYAAELSFRQESLELQDERGDMLAGGER